MSENRIIEGLTEAVAIANGERPAARIHVNGHAYIPEALEFRPPIPDSVLAEMVERGARALAIEAGEEEWPAKPEFYRFQASSCIRAALGLDRAAADAVKPEER